MHASHFVQVEALEHDKHVITDAFERVVSEMQGDLQDVRSRYKQQTNIKLCKRAWPQRCCMQAAPQSRLQSVLLALL
jgi:hypothetical protein